MCIVVKNRKFTEDKVLINVNAEQRKQLKLHFLPYTVTLYFTYAVDEDDPNIGVRVIGINGVCLRVLRNTPKTILVNSTISMFTLSNLLGIY